MQGEKLPFLELLEVLALLIDIDYWQVLILLQKESG
jgi:hypothetical protein